MTNLTYNEESGVYEPIIRCHDTLHGIVCDFTGSAAQVERHVDGDYHWAGGLEDDNELWAWAVEWNDFDRHNNTGGNWRGTAPSYMIRRSTGPDEKDWVYVLREEDLTQQERDLLALQDLTKTYNDMATVLRGMGNMLDVLGEKLDVLRKQALPDEDL